MNRTPGHAHELAEKFHGEVVPFCDIKEILAEVDLCVCSASAPHYILDQETVQKSIQMRKSQELVIIDISVPRNIDPQIAQVEQVKLYDIDDLDSALESNMIKRYNAVQEVEQIVEDKLREYYEKLRKINIPESVDVPESVETA